MTNEERQEALKALLEYTPPWDEEYTQEEIDELAEFVNNLLRNL